MNLLMVSSGLSLTSLDMSGFVDTEERERERELFKASNFKHKTRHLKKKLKK